MENTKAAPINLWFRMIVLQAIFCIIVLLAVLVTKFCFKPTFKRLEKWYKNNMTQTTSVSEVLEKNHEN